MAAYLIAKRPHHVNTKLGQYLSPLVAALHKRYFDIAKLLYQVDADVDIKGGRNRTPLYAVTVEGSSDIIAQ